MKKPSTKKKDRPFKALAIRSRTRDDKGMRIGPGEVATIDFAGALPSVTIKNNGRAAVYVRGCQ